VAESGHKAVVWCDPDQVDLIRAAADRAAITIVGAGSAQVGRAGEVAAALGTNIEHLNDLRAALATTQAELVLLAAPGDFGAAGTGAGERDAEDAAVLAAARARGVRILSLEPMPASVLQVAAPTLVAAGEIEDPDSGPGIVLGPNGAPPSPAAQGGGAATWGGWAEFCAPVRISRAMRDAADLLEQIAPVHTAAVECWCGRGQGSLGSRVFDAMDAIVSVLGDPEQVDAVYVWPVRGRAVRPEPGESLRGLSGDLTANLRFADGRGGTIVASNRAGRWNRSVTLVGEGGRLRVYDDGFVWIGSDGRTVDSSRDPSRKRSATGTGDDAGAHAAAAIADHIARVLDPHSGPARPTDYRRVLAAAGAALLSARTGEGESPGTILKMAGGG